VYIVFRARKTLFGAVVAGLAAATFAAYMVATANLAFITSLVGKDITFTGRSLLWQDLIGEIMDRPLLGSGYSGFWGGWFSPAHEIWVKHAWLPPDGHNVLIELALNLGLIGMAAFAFTLARGIGRAITYVRDHNDAVGLFPLMFFSFIMLFSATEGGIVDRTMYWVLFVYLVAVVANVTPAAPIVRRGVVEERPQYSTVT